MQDLEAVNLKNRTVKVDFEKDLSSDEQELLREIFQALRTTRYGSVVLTVHDGRVVEIQKTERIRKGAARQA